MTGEWSDLDDGFAGPRLDPAVWTDHYLPHWTTPDRSAARYDLGADGLRLRIDADQPGWRPEDPPLRVSSVQTADFSGPVGSQRGIHRHRPDGLLVRSERPLRLGWAPHAGRLEVTLSASTDPGCMTAAWLVGTEHRAPGEAGEICLFEIDADAIGAAGSRARVGVKAHGDARMTNDMAEVGIPVDASRPHTWSLEWGAGITEVRCAGALVRRIEQAPDYPLVLLLSLFEIAEPAGEYPKSAVFHRVRGRSA